jgi:hypothetical protein
VPIPSQTTPNYLPIEPYEQVFGSARKARAKKLTPPECPSCARNMRRLYMNSDGPHPRHKPVGWLCHPCGEAVLDPSPRNHITMLGIDGRIQRRHE